MRWFSDGIGGYYWEMHWLLVKNEDSRFSGTDDNVDSTLKWVIYYPLNFSEVDNRIDNKRGLTYFLLAKMRERIAIIDTGCDAEFRIPGIPNSEFRIRNSEFRNSEFPAEFRGFTWSALR